MQIVIEVVEGPHCGRKFVFDGHDSFIVGRARCAHFRLPKKDPYFSRVHFMIEANPPCCRLVDMGSTNGTRVNGRRVRTVLVLAAFPGSRSGAGVVREPQATNAVAARVMMRETMVPFYDHDAKKSSGTRRSPAT